MARIRLTTTHRLLAGVVIAGAVLIAGIGFAGSYTAVRDLATAKGFGAFAAVFPIGIDAGIVVLLALDLLLTSMRIPFPLLRQTAWFLTAATIAFNGAAAWPDPLGVGMHATIPLLFITTVEAARHAIGRIADITADRHMEPVRLTRWLLAPAPTFRLWRRMKLWELRNYDHALTLERDRLVHRTRLRARYGPRWRRKAPPEDLLALKLAKYGVPLPTATPTASESGTTIEREAPERAALEPETPPPTEPGPALGPAAQPTVPVGPGRRRALANGHTVAEPAPVQDAVDTETAFEAYCDYSDLYGRQPTGNELAGYIQERSGAAGRGNVLVNPTSFRRHLPDFERRYQERSAAREAAGKNGYGGAPSVPEGTSAAGPKGHSSPDPVADVR